MPRLKGRGKGTHRKKKIDCRLEWKAKSMNGEGEDSYRPLVVSGDRTTTPLKERASRAGT